jgi:hypothetical protein
MLGWSIEIRREGDADAVLGTWLVGPFGVKWLNELVKLGEAEFTDNLGYPNTYTLAAGHVRQALASGIPTGGGPPVIGDDYELPSGWVGDPRVDLDALNALPADARLVVIAWDQS